MRTIAQDWGKHAGTLTHYAYMFAYKWQLVDNRSAKLLADQAMNFFVGNQEYYAIRKANQSLDLSLGHLRWDHPAFSGLPKDGSADGLLMRFLEKNIFRRWVTPAKVFATIDEGLRNDQMASH